MVSDIITVARALLAAATPGPVTVYPHPRPRQDHDESRFQWGDLVTGGRSMWTMIPMADAKALAFAVNNIGTLCDALQVAEAERDALRAEVERLRARKAEVCDCVHATGMIGESFVDVDDGCSKCGGSGAVIVEECE